MQDFASLDDHILEVVRPAQANTDLILPGRPLKSRRTLGERRQHLSIAHQIDATVEDDFAGIRATTERHETAPSSLVSSSAPVQEMLQRYPVDDDRVALGGICF